MRLGDISEIRYGIKTGANDFFYLNEERIRDWEIEEEFLRPVIKSPKECKRILVDTKDTKNKIFICHKNRKALEGTYALLYIKWGEKQGYNENASVSGRRHWWYAPYISGNTVFVKEANDTSAVFYNPQNYPVDCRLYCADLPKASFLFLNSPIAAMMFEIYNRAGLGEGARSLMVSDYASIPCLGDTNLCTDSKKVIDEISSLPARKLLLGRDVVWSLLDDAIYNALDLTQDERDAIYEAVISLVEARLNKAGSVNRRWL